MHNVEVQASFIFLTVEAFFAGNVSQDFSNLDALDLDDTLELLESTQDSLDEIWKQEDHKPYPEARMKHLLDVMAGALSRYVQRKLGSLDIWHDSFQQVKDSMRKGITVCERWVSTCSETLTSQYWKRFLFHPWKGEKFVPENLSQLASRLEEVNSTDPSKNDIQLKYVQCAGHFQVDLKMRSGAKPFI